MLAIPVVTLMKSLQPDDLNINIDTVAYNGALGDGRNINLELKGEDIIQYYKHNYGDFFYLSFDGEQPESEFMSEWAIYKYTEIANWRRKASAILSDYNPLSNYDMQETNSGTDETTATRTGSITNKAENTYESSDDTSNFETTYDNDSVEGTTHLRNATKGLGTDTSKGESTTNYNDIKDRAESITKSTITRSGNIGVTTATQMIQEILKLNYNWYYSILETFAQKVFYLLADDEEYY